MRAILFVLSLILVAPYASAQAACQSSSTVSCDVYLQCIEANCNCAASSSDYSATFGPKYCSRFASESSFSSTGKNWRDNTLTCLRDEISLAYVANSDTNGRNCDCAAIQSAAVDSHSSCYLGAPSFCALSESDVRAIARIVDSPDVVALGASGAAEMGIVLATCYWDEGLDKGNLILSAFITETISENTEAASDLAAEMISAAIRHAIEAAQNAAEQELRRRFEEFFPAELPRL